MTPHQQPYWFLWVSGFTCKTETLAFSSSPEPPSLLHWPAPSAGKLSEGLFSKMGNENSSLFVLAAVPFPAEEAQCLEDWAWDWASQGATRRSWLRGWGVSVRVWVPLKQGARAALGVWVSVLIGGDGSPPLCCLLW